MPEPKNMLSDEARYRLLKLLSENPEMSQRDLAKALDMSLGKANYCMRALIEQGWIKVINFRNSRHKAGYIYQLTPKGISEKAHATHSFLMQKIKEYEQLKEEINELRNEMSFIPESKSAPAE